MLTLSQVVLAALFIIGALAMRRRRMQRNGVTYVGTAANAQNVNYNGQNPGYLPSYTPAYYPGQVGPQYPPAVHGYDPQSGFAPVSLMFIFRRHDDVIDCDIV